MEKTLNHFAGAFRWSTEKEVTAIEITVSALAMAVPALLAARGHHTGLGLIGGRLAQLGIARGVEQVRDRDLGKVRARRFNNAVGGRSGLGRDNESYG